MKKPLHQPTMYRFSSNAWKNGTKSLQSLENVASMRLPEGLEKMAGKFASPNHIGPNFVADFEDIEDEEEREMLKRDVFERVDHLLRGLSI